MATAKVSLELNRESLYRSFGEAAGHFASALEDFAIAWREKEQEMIQLAEAESEKNS